mgnify:CR=1 FL=1
MKLEFFADEAMNPLGVVTRVAQDRPDRLTSTSFANRLDQMRIVRPGSQARHRRQNEMRSAIGEQADLRKAAVLHFQNVLIVPLAAADEIVTGVLGGKASAVNGGQLRT